MLKVVVEQFLKNQIPDDYKLLIINTKYVNRQEDEMLPCYRCMFMKHRSKFYDARNNGKYPFCKLCWSAYVHEREQKKKMSQATRASA